MTKPERTIDGHKITRLGRGHYAVCSQSRMGISYAVDILAHSGLGYCNCEDQTFRRFPRWKAVRANFDHFRCRHIRAVRNHVLDQILHPYVKEEEDG